MTLPIGLRVPRLTSEKGPSSKLAKDITKPNKRKKCFIIEIVLSGGGEENGACAEQPTSFPVPLHAPLLRSVRNQKYIRVFPFVCASLGSRKTANCDVIAAPVRLPDAPSWIREGGKDCLRTPPKRKKKDGTRQ